MQEWQPVLKSNRNYQRPRLLQAYNIVLFPEFRGMEADINFVLDGYKEDISKMSVLSKEEHVQVLRWQGTGFVRGSSRFVASPCTSAATQLTSSRRGLGAGDTVQHHTCQSPTSL